jgi:hypothetical protein
MCMVVLLVINNSILNKDKTIPKRYNLSKHTVGADNGRRNGGR